MNIIIFGSEYPSTPIPKIHEVIQILVDSCDSIWIESGFRTFLAGTGFNVSSTKIFNKVSEIDQAFFSKKVVVLSIGGDGTYLRTAHKMIDHNLPIFGVNIGRLGFLAATSAKVFESAWREILRDNYDIVERSMLDVCIEHDGIEKPFTTALNEVVVSKKDTGSMISVNAFIDDKKIATYMADGLIVSTPTGSTAYSLSVNGPIIAPNTSTLCITPVAPHTLNMRPLVVVDNSEIRLSVNARNNSFLLSTDGRTKSLKCTHTITLKKSKQSIRSIQVPGYSFYQTLRDKLMWGMDIRYNAEETK